MVNLQLMTASIESLHIHIFSSHLIQIYLVWLGCSNNLFKLFSCKIKAL